MTPEPKVKKEKVLTQRELILERIKAGMRAAKIDSESVPRGWSDRVEEDIPVILTPSAQLNAALGVGGIPYGRIIEIYGGEASGKTTLTLQLVAQAQRDGKVAAFIDMAHSLDAKYAEALGVNMNDVLISQPSNGDTAFGLVKILAESGVSLIVVDDVPALVSRAELEKEITDTNVGLQARMMSQALRQLETTLGRSGTCLIFINQLRMKIGVMYGNPETTPGGIALKYFASVRLDMRIKKREEDRQATRIKVVKNKVAAPYRECLVDIIYGKGIDRVSDAIRHSKSIELIQQRGAWMYLPRLKCIGIKDVDVDLDLKFQGESDARIFIEQTEGYIDALMEACNRHGGTKL